MKMGVAALVFILLAVIFMPISVIIFSRVKDEKTPLSGMRPPTEEKVYHISVFAFPKTVTSLEDVTAKQFEQYRNEGKVHDFNDFKSVYSKTLLPENALLLEVGQILISAKEVKRTEKNETFYFFTKVQSGYRFKFEDTAQLHRVMNRHISDGDTVVVRIIKEEL